MERIGGRKMERETGFEPATSTLARSHSTTELFPLASTRGSYHSGSQRGKQGAANRASRRKWRVAMGEPGVQPEHLRGERMRVHLYMRTPILEINGHHIEAAGLVP